MPRRFRAPRACVTWASSDSVLTSRVFSSISSLAICSVCSSNVRRCSICCKTADDEVPAMGRRIIKGARHYTRRARHCAAQRADRTPRAPLPTPPPSSGRAAASAEPRRRRGPPGWPPECASPPPPPLRAAAIGAERARPTAPAAQSRPSAGARRKCSVRRKAQPGQRSAGNRQLRNRGDARSGHSPTAAAAMKTHPMRRTAVARCMS
jgi:hypothetical protein